MQASSKAAAAELARLIPAASVMSSSVDGELTVPGRFIWTDVMVFGWDVPTVKTFTCSSTVKWS